MRVLVTGGCGFIGSALVRRLRKYGFRVDVVDDMSAGDLTKLADAPLRVVPADLISVYQHTAEIEEQDVNQVLVFEGDFAHSLVLNRIAQGTYGYVFHCAADPRVEYSVQNPLDTTENNVTKTVALLSACVGTVNRFIFSSSAAVYGSHSGEVNETTTPDPESPYALQKLMIDQMLPMFYKFHGLDSASLRYFNVYGPGHNGTGAYATAVAAWCNALKSSKSLRADGSGNQTRDLIYVDDVAEANLLAALHSDDLEGRTFNICTGNAVSNNEILQMIWKACGPHDRKNAPPRPGDIDHSLGDPAGAKNTLGFEAQIPFKLGLELTLAWWDLL